MYQRIKDAKRSVVLKDEMGIKLTKEDDPFNKIFKKLLDGLVKNGSVIDGFAEGMGITPDALRSQIVRELKRVGKPPSVSHYYWSKKDKDKDEKFEFVGDRL